MSAATDSDRKSAEQEARDDRSIYLRLRRYQDLHWDAMGWDEIRIDGSALDPVKEQGDGS